MAPNKRDKNSIFAMTALFAIIVACIVTAGCMGSTSTPGLTGISWSLDSYLDENGTLVPVLQGTTITARFDDDGTIAGSAGCNLYSGGYHQDKTALSVSTLAQTLKFCMEPEGIMEQEARFMELIGSAAGWQINDGRLSITDATGATTLVFEVEEPMPIAGTSWTLASLAGENGTMIPVIAGATVTATFSADGNLGGNAGCNHYAADYTVDGANLSIRPTTQTEMYCGEPEGIMAQEDRYLVLIADVASYRIEGDRLFLADSEGNGLLVFEKAVPVPDLPLVGTDWVLDGYRTDGDAISSVIAGTKVTVMFADDGKIGGNAGCNLYGGSYTLNGTNLSVSSLFSTLMYCGEPEGTMEQEGRYLGLLENVSSYRVDGNRLTLTDAAGTDLLFFVEAEKVPPAPLTGTEWTLESYRLDEAVSSVIFGTTITATFSPDGNVTGNAGCNRYFAAYEAAESTMTIGPAGSTKMYCGEPEGTMEQEGRYLGLLENVSSYRVDGNRLTLTDAVGTDLLFFVEAEKVPPAPLTGTEWTLESYRLDEAISSVIFGTTITATFSPDGNVTGNAGCNRYFAAYEAAESTMTIGSAGSTKMYCGEPEGTMEQEARYLGLLESVTGYRIDADQLDLFDEEGRTLLTYRAEGADRS